MNTRIPPQALDIERTVLGSILIDSAAADVAIEMLNESCFYATAHKLIFAAIVEMNHRDAPVDIITLSEELRRQEKIDQVGSEAYLSELVESVATVGNVAYYCDILKSKSTLRELISLSANVQEQCFGPCNNSKEVLDCAGEKIFQLSESNIKSDFEPIGKLLSPAFDRIESYGKGAIPGLIKTGFSKIDESTGGFTPPDLIIIAGRPGTGKTSLAIQVCTNVAKKGPGVAMFSLEMSKGQIVERVLCVGAKIDSKRMRAGHLQKRELNTLGFVAGPIFEIPFYIDDTPGITVLDLKAKVRRLKRKYNIGLVVIDYLQLMRGSGKQESKQAEVSQISQGLKGAAKELGVPVIALSQLSRSPDQRGGDHRPQLSDLRESGAIEQDADVVMFTYREYSYFPEKENLRNIAEIIIGKQRNGPTGSFKMSYVPEFTFFGDLEEVKKETDIPFNERAERGGDGEKDF